MVNILKSWKEASLNSLDYLLLEFKQGVVPIQVVQHYVSIYQPYTGIGTLNPQSATTANNGSQSILINGSDLLAIPQQYENLIYQTFVGVKPGSINMWINSPSSTPYRGSLYNITPIDIVTNPYGFIKGYDTPYEEPTEISEIFSVYGMQTSFSFRNTDILNEQLVSLSFYINIIVPRILKMDNPYDKPVIEEMINTLSVNKQPVKYFQMGFIYLYDFPTNLAKVWGVKPIPVEYGIKSNSLSGGA